MRAGQLSKSVNHEQVKISDETGGRLQDKKPQRPQLGRMAGFEKKKKKAKTERS